jgi:pimeloyl-ACP methyl ester carboxylesterase
MTREAVILVHGHGAHPVLLVPLRRALERQGFRAVNWRYGSTSGSIEVHAARLAAEAKELDDDKSVEGLHFVGHSMGAIVVRRALAMTRPRKLGRVVLLAPPNRGARLADMALRLFGQRPVAAVELSSHSNSYVNRLAPAPDLDCGVIAASWDHCVPLASTYLLGLRDHIVLRSCIRCSYIGARLRK